MDGKYYTNENQIADDLHAVHTQHRHSLAAQSVRTREKNTCMYVRVRMSTWMGKANRKPKCEALELYSFLGFPLLIFDPYNYRFSKKNRVLFAPNFIHLCGLQNETVRNFLPFKEYLGVLCACIEMQRNEMHNNIQRMMDTNWYNYL